MNMAKKQVSEIKAELIKADTALRSFRDGGYHLGDAVGEAVDNSIQSGATVVRLDWEITEEEEPPTRKGGRGKPKVKKQIERLAIADNGTGIPANILPNVLTIGFSTRYGSR